MIFRYMYNEKLRSKAYHFKVLVISALANECDFE